MKFGINLVEALGGHLLAGRAAGSRDLAALMERISQTLEQGQIFDPSDAEKVLLVLDFERVSIATSSYLAAAILPLWTWEAVLRSNVYPVLANLTPGVQDEIEFVLKARNTAAWAGRCMSDQLTDVSLVGTLDDSLRTTLRCFSPSAELGATDLALSDEKIGATAWNNRLTTLHELRLLHRRRVGRRQVYSLSWLEVNHG